MILRNRLSVCAAGIACLLLLGSMAAAQDVGELITRLGNSSQETQLEAARALSGMGYAAIRPLCEAVQGDSNKLVRKNAAAALGMIRSDIAVEALIAGLSDSEGMVRWSCAWALGEIGDGSAVQPLCNALKDRDWTTRMRAAEALGKLGDESAISHLFGVLRDRQSEVRDAARAAMASIKGE